RAGVLLIQHIVGTPEQQLAHRLGNTRYDLNTQVLLSIPIKILAKAVIDQGTALESLQILAASVEQLLATPHPDHAVGMQERRVYVVHIFNTRLRHERTGQHIYPPATRLVLSSRPGAGVDNVDFNIESATNALEQLGICAH